MFIITIDHKRCEDNGVNDATLMVKNTAASWKLDTRGQTSNGS